MSSVDLARLSQKALYFAKKYDIDNNKTLDTTEYKNFMNAWVLENNSESPLLMQLHINSLTNEAKKIAQECDTDDLKGVLTELEIQAFIDKYENSGLKKVFKDNVDVSEVLTGKRQIVLETSDTYEEKSNNFINKCGVKWNLFKNWLKLDIMNYRGTDKFFHAVGNFEAMLSGSENEVKKVCSGQDEDKRENMQRPEADYTEDLYANWLGREFAKMYPNVNPHVLFKPLAPEKFETENAESNVVKLAFKKQDNNNDWLSKKYHQYKNYFSENFIIERIKKEANDLLN